MADYDRALADAADNAKAADETLQRLSAGASSPRGEVTLRVGPGGALQDITLTPAARALEAEQLAQLILTTAQDAQRSIGNQVVGIMTDYVGDGPVLDFVKQNLPEAADAEEPARSDDDYFANPPTVFG
ncbi:YbaB/EbfC family nucleoid-associated protein [Saccharopolyspora montiporae]|uniref:YbaB/EbfC family nucleoid-associated protein n=1 Tax=Saccharopolyspora montiporae TaxID=2781240 RepID=UPI001D151514|nr:YbaB/EbfC family nucleoid-associated protein [Saccharopolyspora sp. HNM0983]